MKSIVLLQAERNGSQGFQCQNLSLAGHNDWRLPTYKELASILYFGFSSSHRYALNETFFQSTATTKANGRYWTSSTFAGDTNFAWTFRYWSSYYSDIGYTELASKINNTTTVVKCVRGSSLQSPNFANNGNGTITDTTTGLMWQQQDDGITKTWENAIKYCESLSLAGYDDWRLPNIKELSSIVDTSTYNPAADITYFPMDMTTTTNRWWSSTYNPGDAHYQYVYSVDFYDGEWQPLSEPNYLNHSRCVRGGH